MKPSERLAQSENVIALWEAHGQPGGPIADNLRLIGEELTKLLSIATDAPHLAQEVDEVAYRYRLMEARLKRGLN
jgi:hypothetical protein